MSKAKLTYLGQEAALILLGGYFLFFGATLNGLAGGSVPNVWNVPLSMWLNIGLVGAISLAWLGGHVWRRSWVAMPPLLFWLVVLVAAYILTSLTSMDPRRSLNALWTLVWAIWVFLLVYDLAQNGWPVEVFIKAWLVLGVIIAGFVFWRLIDWELRWLSLRDGEGSWFPPIWPRFAPFYSHANMVAAFLNLLWPPALAWFWRARTCPGRLWCVLMTAACWLVILFASSRGAILGIGGALAGMALLAADRRHLTLPVAGRRTRSWLRWAAAAAALVAMGIGGWQVVQKLSHPTHADDLWGSRSVYWQAAWEAFRRSPLVGSGPDTYASDFLRQVSVPPNALFVRAHSMVMHVLAETGLIGWLAATALVMAIVVAVYRRWRIVRHEHKHWLVGLSGGLITTAVHSLVDTPMAIPAITQTLLMWLALLLALETPPPPARPAGSLRAWLKVRERPLGTAVALATAVFFVGSGIWMQYGYAPYYIGSALGNMEKWEAALPYLEEATRRDPGHAYYHLQAATAYGHAAAVVPARADEFLLMAVKHYAAGIAREPYYSVNHANLAVVLWQQGRQVEAIAEMMRAAYLAPQAVVYPLNLGIYYEKRGETTLALEAYRRALDLRPDWARAPFWKTNEVRRQAQADWQAALPGAPVVAARDAQADLELAEQKLLANPADVSAYMLKALALEALGRLAEAERAMRLAEFCAEGGGAAVSVETVNDIAYHRARLAYALGRREAALPKMEAVVDAVRRQTLFGPHGEGTALYGWGIFYRVGWHQDILPGLGVIRLTDEQIRRWLILGEWYTAGGRTEAARQIYREVLEADPDNALAAELLAALAD